MSTVGATGQKQDTPAPVKPGFDAFDKVDMKAFLDLMIAELQNQDPMNPMDNAQFMEQLGQLRSIAATDKMTTTLDNVSQGQAFSSASSLIGRKISGLDDDAKEVSGVVEKATVVDGAVRVHVGEKSISLSNVKEILPG